MTSTALNAAARLLLAVCAALAPAIPEAASTAPAFPYSVVYRCLGGSDSCAQLDGALIQGSDGNFYGTSEFGGANSLGMVFRLTAEGVLTVLHSFKGSDGAHPVAGLVQASDGNFYGTTTGVPFGAPGTIFQISPAGSFTSLHTFVGQKDGSLPVAPMIQASDGNLYGTASSGGAHGGGTVFRISMAGDYATLHSFADHNGLDPESALTETPDGFLWGETAFGGSDECGASAGCGTLFKMSFDGQLTVTHRFGAIDHGIAPRGALVLASDGALYGTTTYGGGAPGCIEHGCGTIFKITLDRQFSTLYRFKGDHKGSYPQGTLLQASDGNFYGTAWEGGRSPRCVGGGCGTVFQFSPAGTFAKIHAFRNSPDGANPTAGLLQAADGGLYGTTQRGGTRDLQVGVVFRID